MANYSIIANNTFQPFSYQELAAPLDRQEAYHEKLAEEYDKLSSQADVLEAMGDNDRDKKAYSQYKNYSDRLRAEADNLYRNGLNTESRMRLSELRRMYNTDIIPIQNAWNKREQEAELQLKAQLQNPSIMFTRDARNTALDEYIANPTGGFGVINGNNISTQMAAMAKNLEKQVRSGNRENIDDFTYNYIEKHGLTPDMIRDWRNNPTLSAMFSQVMEANGVTPEALQGSANMQNIINQSTGYAEMGMWNALGEDKSHIMDNFKAREDYKFNQEMEAYRRKKMIEGALAGNEDSMPNIPSVAVGLTPTEEYTAKNLEALNSLKAGNDGFKSSYFGKTLGQVNPMKVYEDYQEELKNRRGRGADISPTTYSPVSERSEIKADASAAKKAVLEKYKKYGITDILTDDQYKAMSSLGYSSDKKMGTTNYSTMLKKFNETIEQKSRYSTNMTDYSAFNDRILPNLNTRAKYGKESGTVWEIKEDGKKGNPVSIKKMNLKSKDNTKGNEVTDVQYDPEFKGKIVLQLSDGSLYVTDPNVYDGNLARMINDAEHAPEGGAHPQAITAMIYEFLNKKNKIQGKTDSKIE